MRLLFFLIIPILCFSQEDGYRKLNEFPNSEFEKAVTDSIVKLQSGDLWNFLKVLKDDYKTDLNTFHSSFIKKIETTKWPMDMHFLLNFLIEQKTDKVVIENILNKRKEIWNKGLWSEKFWKVIRENKLNVTEDLYYSVNQKGQKTYNTNLYIENKMKNNEIGLNPLLFLNNRLISYPENQLLQTLAKLNIKDIEIVSMEEGPKLYGKRGIDGMLKILTN